MNSVKRIISKFSIPISFLILTLVAYWPLLLNCMKFDILDQYLPWRYLVGQCLQSGHLPLWNPYTHLGYQLFADPQSGAWYPIVWLIGGIFGYNIYWIQAEFLFHVWLAGCGMYLLTKALVKDEKVAWLAGASFLLSGFFTGNAQHITWIISGAWIPFILYYFLMMTRSSEWKDSLLCALCFFMLITGGYPAFSIVLLYIFFALCIIIILRKIVQRQNAIVFIKSLLLFIMVSMALSAVMMVSVAESFKVAGRAAGLSREMAMENPFSPQSLLSWILPFSSIKNAGFFKTDVSMSNGYFGLLMLSGFLISLFRKKTIIEILILSGSVLLLLVAMGDYTPLRGLLYDFIPLMNLFRMPSLFRLFVIIGFILLASFSLVELLNGRSNSAKLVNALKLSAGILFFGILIFVITSSSSGNMNFESYAMFFQEMQFKESVALQGLIQLICIGFFLVLLKKKNSFYLLILDGVLACWMCAPVTIVSNLKVSELVTMTNQLPQDFKLPELTPMNQNMDRYKTIGPLWCNLGIWKKQPIYDGYNNFQTKGFIRFENSFIAKFVLQNPVVYQSYSSSLMQNNDADTLLLFQNPTHLLVEEPLRKKLAFSSEGSRTSSSPQLIQFTPSKIEAVVNNKFDSYFTMLQQYDDGWKVSIDDVANEKFRSNGLFISTVVPAGKHRVTFEFTNLKITIAFYISIVSLLVVISILIIKKKKLLLKVF